jgi:hypothetical protein
MAGEGAGSLELKKADPLHQLRPVVLHVANLGPDLPRIDRGNLISTAAASSVKPG